MSETGLFLYCRPGFERECAAEIQAVAAQQGVAGYCKAKPDAAYVVFRPHAESDTSRLAAALDVGDLIFARQWFEVIDMRNDLPLTDRVSALLDSVRARNIIFDQVVLETPDTNEGKQLSALCRSLERPLKQAIEQAGLLSETQREDGMRLHICFLATNAAYIGCAPMARTSPWSMGIPRLKFPSSAPSRSTLKLEEAILTFLSTREQNELLKPGSTAVDLGASPGGWTWQLVKRHMRVIAVDNGAMDAKLLESGLVEHLRQDGFRYQPAAPVQWMVCDIVEQPIRIAELAARWLERGWCEHALFNLKLPMKKRYQEVQQCLALLEERLNAANIPHRVRCKQLYHDREEVTCLITTG